MRNQARHSLGRPAVSRARARAGNGPSSATDPSARRLAGAPTSIVVRQATLADLATVTEMRLALLAEEARSPIVAPIRADARERARRLGETQIRGGRDGVFLAFVAREAAGVLRCAIAHSSPLLRGARHAVLTTAYVRPAFRRRGVLTALVHTADEWCRSHHVREMRLRCTIDNDGGNAAWQALGFYAAEILRRRRVPRT